MPTARIGLRCKLYRNTGTFAAPVWDEVPIVGDFTVTPTWEYATLPTRETAVMRGARTMIDFAITGKLKVDLTSPDYIAFRVAFLDATAVLDLMILNGASNENDVEGFRGEFHVTNWAEDQSPGSILARDFELKPALTNNAFQSVLVATGAPVFTTIQ